MTSEALPLSRPQMIVGPGNRVRFAVIAEDGRRSLTWTIWTSRHTLDAYITVRPMKGRWKVSLHQSGSWQSGFTLEEYAKLDPAPPSRHSDIWERPEEVAPGVRRSVMLTVPDDELRKLPEGTTDDKPVTRIPAAGPGHAACIEFIFMAPETGPLNFAEPIFDLAQLGLHDGSNLRVVSRLVPWTRPDAEWVRTYKTDMLTSEVGIAVLKHARHPRGFLSGFQPDGTRFFLDVAGDLD